MARAIRILGLALALLPAAGQGGAATLQGITILSGSYGRPDNWHRMDIAARLQDLCGDRGNSCEVFCSPSSFGGRDLGRHSACRVIYRCPDGATRAAEAARDEPIMLRCATRAAEEG